VAAKLRGAAIRTRVDDRSESVGRKIRDAELARAPFMLVVGDREQEDGLVAVRSHDEGDMGTMPAGEFVQSLAERIASRSAA
jgi:threonyl-tRNA synthetase